MAVDMFLQLQDVTGEAQDEVHGEEIDVLSWSWGMSQSGTTHAGSGSGGGKVSVHDLSITKYVDKATATLMKYCTTGKHIESGKLTVRKAGGDSKLEYFIIELNDIIITSYQTGGSGGEDRHTENVSLNFGSYKTSYTPQKADGSGDAAVEWAYDIAAGNAM
jgi:type VI secretion system secreted protein Hcp